ncbi:MAG: methyltransferase domain-containing protein [Pseudonocardia sp.]
MDHDLHAAFVSAGPGAHSRAAFLEAADRLPGFAAVRSALRAAAPLHAGQVLLDAGCGLGLETVRLATDHPGATVVGLDRDAALLTAARERAAGGPGNLCWVLGDVTGPGLAPGSVDVVRTERVLIYVEPLRDAVAALARLLRRGGVLATYELDYGGTLLAPGALPHTSVRTLTACLADALPQPWAGRQLPAVAAACGMDVVAARPYAFETGHTVWARIVGDTLRAAAADGRLDEPGLDAWLAELDDPDFPGFRAAFTGVLTVARRP